MNSHFLLIALGAFFLCSCEDKALLAKKEEQAERIEELRADLAARKALLDEDLAPMPKESLEKLEKEHVALKSELARVKSKLTMISEQQDESEKTFAEYRGKYPMQ